MARRGLLGEIQYQIRQAERRQRAAEREHQAAIRRAEQARKAEERAKGRAARAAEADRKRMEKEAKAAHVAAMQAEVEERNSDLAETYDAIDTLLAATLEVDDYVDLETLRMTVEHSPFDPGDLASPIPEPTPTREPVEPRRRPVPQPKALFGRRKKHERAVASAEAIYTRAHKSWAEDMEKIRAQREADAKEHARLESERKAQLEALRTRYEAECAAREAEAAAHNKRLDKLITDLGYGVTEAIHEYVSVVLSNSVYPEHFPVDHTYSFDPASAELTLRVLVPPPTSVPQIKAYRYVKSSDEITTTALSQKAQRDRYSGAVFSVAIRSLHEIFEADRRGLVRTVSAEVGTETTDPATGKDGYFPFVAVSAERETFLEFDLSTVVPEATLRHLGGSVSKNPFGLIRADTAGIRRA